ncbi:NADH-quinone oxidoreductase subunit E [Nitrosomonas marina]|uniref:NADH-quinone oxidoreductase subunit E n=1 Tax=Nitrosomonas marina TaxID=917 RepID=A0A1H9ZXI6_9PROT|nr:NAD(P)H-dependent oxidoreductase subunit E [Nitrosomonas marina]SES86496.1 NADH-quinone oxidoreductase subunit E [Nitrosomonas marina]
MTDIDTLQKDLANLPPDHPDRREAAVPAMLSLQSETGYLDDAAIEKIAEVTGLSSTEIEELATFYSLIYRCPTGRHIVQICDSVCCSMRGADQLLTAAENYLGAPLGGLASECAPTVLPSICLGLCDKAPAALVDGEAAGPLNRTLLETLLKRLQTEE